MSIVRPQVAHLQYRLLVSSGSGEGDAWATAPAELPAQWLRAKLGAGQPPAAAPTGAPWRMRVSEDVMCSSFFL